MRRLIIMMICLFSITMQAAELTPSNVYQECVKQGIAHPEIVTAQSIQETGWYKCTFCSMSNNNNIFGFWLKDSYLKFESWEASVKYYKGWQDDNYTTGKNYYEFLACLYITKKGRCVKYAADPNYIGKVKSIVNKYGFEWKES